MTPKISIIIPVYNVEEVLCRCLDSVVNQTFSDFECILVDDCSPDNCPAICDEYVAKDNRFVVIHKKQNDGLPKARKTGFDAAKGEFVLHIDSDDWIELNSLEILVNKQNETNADVVFGRFKNIYNNHEKIYFNKFENKFQNHLVDVFFNTNTKVIWGKLYKKELFNEYIVPPVNMGEDTFTNIQILYKTPNIKMIQTDFYIYNYDKRVGMTSMKKNRTYNSIVDFPHYRIYKIIEDYLHIQSEGNQDIVSAYKYDVFVSVIIPYMRSNKNLSYNEIKEFYYNYYMKCKFRNFAPLYMRATMLFLYYLGKYRNIILLHFWIMNVAKTLKYKLILKV
jgi:glycosyltransferase involved in cell wall biosynthesis